MRKVAMESWEELRAEELALADVQDEAVVDDLGIEYEAWEELAVGSKEFERDRHRWELDPASAEDFADRGRVASLGPALPWRHFGH